MIVFNNNILKRLLNRHMLLLDWPTLDEEHGNRDVCSWFSIIANPIVEKWI